MGGAHNHQTAIKSHPSARIFKGHEDAVDCGASAWRELFPPDLRMALLAHAAFVRRAHATGVMATFPCFDRWIAARRPVLIERFGEAQTGKQSRRTQKRSQYLRVIHAQVRFALRQTWEAARTPNREPTKL